MIAEAAPLIGHNRPPVDDDAAHERLLLAVGRAQALTAAFFAVPVERITAQTRGSPQDALLRQLTYWLLAQGLGLKSAQIARGVDRDEATVRHGILVIEDAREAEPAFNAVAELLATAVRGSVGYVAARGNLPLTGSSL